MNKSGSRKATKIAIGVLNGVACAVWVLAMIPAWMPLVRVRSEGMSARFQPYSRGFKK